MKNTVSTPYNPKNIALLVTGILAVIAVGIFFGRGSLFKGSFLAGTVPPLDYVNITFSAGAVSDSPVTFSYGWNQNVVPSASNTTLKDSDGNYQFGYGWYLYDAADVNGVPVWKNEKGSTFKENTIVAPACTAATCAPELIPVYVQLYNTCFKQIDGASYWTCDKGYIPSSVVLDPKKNYVMKVLVYNGETVTDKVASKAFSTAEPTAVTQFVQPLNPMDDSATMTLKNLSVKKLSDGNVVVNYTIDIGGKFTASEFNSEVRLNNSKIFVAKFNEKIKTGTNSYTYEAVLLPWEIRSGDTVQVVMSADGLSASNYVHDGQSVTYDASAKILDAVVGLVTANALPAATVGSPYSTAIVVKDGVAPYKYILGAGSAFPDGLNLDPLTGVLSGTPTKDNSFSFGLSITDAKNAALNATFTLKVVPAPVAGTVVVPATGGTTIINNYTTYSGTGGLPYVAPVVPVTPVAPGNRFLFPINLNPSLFQDVTYHWSRNYINVLWNAGFVQGYTGRTFGPDDSLTRGQLLKIVMESLHYKFPAKVTYNPCVDVQTNQWYAKYFAVAREKGIIGGYVDGTCRPNKITNRAEALKILYAAIAQMPEVPATRITATVPAGYRNTFYDLNENVWYYPYFANAQSLGIVSGFADDTARPDSELSRAQMAKIVVLMMQKLAWAQ